MATVVEAASKAPIALDIPMRWGPGMELVNGDVPDSERCSYLKVGERRCESKAVENGMCRIHSRWQCWAEHWPMVCPDDRESIREVLRQALSWMMAGHITPQQAHAVVAICRAILRTL